MCRAPGWMPTSSAPAGTPRSARWFHAADFSPAVIVRAGTSVRGSQPSASRDARWKAIALTASVFTGTLYAALRSFLPG